MKPGDIVFWQDEKFSRNRFWKIEGVYLGGEGQESLIELRALDMTPGSVGGSIHDTSLVPEQLVRGRIFTPASTIN